MSMLIYNQQKCMFHSNQEIGLEPVPVKVEKQQGLTILKVGQLLEIELTKYDRKKGTIEATYKLFDPFYPANTIEGEIVFKVDLQNEKKWIGFPKEFHSLCKWTIWPLVTQPEDWPLVAQPEEISPQSQKKSLSLKSHIRKLFFGSPS